MRFAFFISLLLHALFFFFRQKDSLKLLEVGASTTNPVFVSALSKLPTETNAASSTKSFAVPLTERLAHAPAGDSRNLVGMEEVLSLGNEPPHYPEEALLKGISGEVGLLIFLAQTGKVETVQISKSSGFPILDDAARKAARFWKVPPEWRSPIFVPVEFVLN